MTQQVREDEEPTASNLHKMPEHRLLEAIILHAIRDVISAPIIGSTFGRPMIKKEAMRYLDSDSEEPFAFRWCLHHLTDDVDSAQRNVLRFCRDPNVKGSLESLGLDVTDKIIQKIIKLE